MVANNRTEGAAVAFAVGLVPAVGIAWIANVDRSIGFPWLLASIATLTPVVGAAVGAWLAPRVDRSRSGPQWRLVLGMASGATILGSYSVGVVATFAWDGVTHPLVAIGRTALYGTYGLLIVGWMLWPIAAVCAYVWQRLIRTLPERPPRVEPNERAGPAR